MGYSISMTARNKGDHKKMLAFMTKNYRSWADVLAEAFPDVPREGTDVSEVTDNLSYAKGSLELGVDYGPSCYGWERPYAFSTMRWMALKIGKKASKFSEDEVTPATFPEPVPYMTYDGDAKWPILVFNTEDEAMAALPKTQWWCSADRNGVYLGAQTSESILTATEELFFDRIRGPELQAEVKALGRKPSGGDAFIKWRDQRRDIRRKYAQPEIDKLLPVLQGEFERLTKLWDAV
jgi:hypothetical protein